MIKILIAEHDKHDQELVSHELKRSGIDYVSQIVENEKGYREALQNFVPDVILCDFTFPSFDGPTAFKIRGEMAPETPFILVSGTVGEENSIELIKNGVTDFVLKDRIFTLNTKLLRALKDSRDQKEKTKTEKDLAASESKLARAQQVAQLGSWELNLDKNELSLSVEGARIFGFPPDQKILSFETWSSLVHPEDIEEVLQTIRQSKETLQDTTYYHRILLKNGTIKHISSESKFEFDDRGKPVGMYGTMQDITESKKNREELRAAFEEINTILESIDDGFFATDKSSLVTYWNRRAEVLLGVKKEDMLGKNFDEIFAKAWPPIFHANFQKAILNRRTVRFEGYSAATNSWFAVSVFPSASGLSVYFKDVTDQKDDEEKIKESELRYRSLIEQANDAIFITDSSLKFLEVNSSACQLLGYSREELGQLTLVDLLIPEDLEVNPLKIKELQSGKTIFNERTVRRKDGAHRELELSGQLLNDGTLVIFGRDITERKRAGIQLSELNSNLMEQAKELANSNLELEKFAYVASHDLQEPLRMVTSFLKLIEKRYSNALDDKGKEYINFAVDGATRMRQIINDLLEYSKVGRTEEKRELVDLNLLVNDILTMFKVNILKKKAIIISEPLPHIRSFHSPLMQVFQNLVANALNYTSKDRAPKITISYTELEDHWQFAVRDNGIGIDEEYFEKIFIIFERLHGKDEYSGTGMGLAITKKIVENLGGIIWVESVKGEGSTFNFTIQKIKGLAQMEQVSSFEYN